MKYSIILNFVDLDEAADQMRSLGLKWDVLRFHNGTFETLVMAKYKDSLISMLEAYNEGADEDCKISVSEIMEKQSLKGE